MEPFGINSSVFSEKEFFRTKVKVYCFNGRPKFLMHIFHTMQMRIEINEDDFVLYEGSTPELVMEEYENKRSLFSFNFWNTNRKKMFKLSPFNQTCIGIETSLAYRVHLNLIRIDFWKIIYLALGLLVFFAASKLSNNALFYYLSGILLGIFASFLVLVYFVSKLLPKVF